MDSIAARTRSTSGSGVRLGRGDVTRLSLPGVSPVVAPGPGKCDRRRSRQMSTSVVEPTGGNRVRPSIGVTIALAVAGGGLLWAKWLPYSERALGLAGSGTWKGTSVLLAGEGMNPLARAWAFTVIY